MFGDLQQFVFPANAELLDRSLAVIVHSHDAAARIRQTHPDLPVHRVPMGVPQEPLAESGGEARERLGIAPGAFVAASFGFVTPIKRADVLLRAWARCRSELSEALLLVVGEVSPQLDLEGLAAELGVSDSVRITGYVSFADWLGYLAASDVCVNLRYPTAGETSASLIRILGQGKPVLVSRYRQFLELPAAAVGFVDLGPPEVPLLARYLAELAANPTMRAKMGAAARRFAEDEHTLERAADAYQVALEATERDRADLAARVAARGPRSTRFRPNSRVPGRLRAGIRLRPSGPFQAAAGDEVRLKVKLTNLGDTRWLKNRRLGEAAGYVVLDARFFDGKDRVVAEQWFDLPGDVVPGDACVVACRVATPEQTGEWTLELDLLDVGFGRFAGWGTRPLRIPVTLG